MIEMKVKTIAMDTESRAPVMILTDIDERRYLPIWIGGYEAAAIIDELEGNAHPRPMTHDLLKNILEKLNIAIEKIVVNDVRNNTFYALIHCRHNGHPIIIDSRPSDAIALALRMSSPIFVEDEVVRKANGLKFDENLETSERLRKWLEGLTPDDFGKYKM